MVDPGDTVSVTLKKEFGEEAMNSLEASPEEKGKIEKQINDLFSQGEEVNFTYHCMCVLYYYYYGRGGSIPILHLTVILTKYHGNGKYHGNN